MPRACFTPALLLLSSLIFAIPAAAQITDAVCDVTFDASWSQETHPVDWPGASAHWSPLIGASHNDQVIFWQPGDLASPGIQSVAEFGATSTFSSEIAAEIQQGHANGVISGGGIAFSPGSVSTTFDVPLSHPLVTLVSMIAPSPDWFVGVHDEPLFVGGRWIDEKIVDLRPYDAGTDSGASFFSGNQITSPPDPISLLTVAPLEGAPSMGTFTFRCVSDVLFLDGFESGDFSIWSSVVGSN